MKKNVRESSVKTYRDIIDEGLLGLQEEIVFDFFYRNPWSSDRECCEFTGLRINCVTGRRNKLVEMGCVLERGRRLCSVSGRNVLVWGVPVRIRLKRNI